MRQIYFDKKIIKYGYFRDDIYFLELEATNKDYSEEIFLSLKGNQIHSFLLKTRKDVDQSQNVRGRILRKVAFSDSSKSLGKILYREFKSLNYSAQIEQEGFIHLFTAWSHWPTSDILKEMISYLERGSYNAIQLNPLYEFAFIKYGSPFSKFRAAEEIMKDPEILLQKKIEQELKDLEVNVPDLEVRPRNKTNKKKELRVY